MFSKRVLFLLLVTVSSIACDDGGHNSKPKRQTATQTRQAKSTDADGEGGGSSDAGEVKHNTQPSDKSEPEAKEADSPKPDPEAKSDAKADEPESKPADMPAMHSDAPSKEPETKPEPKPEPKADPEPEPKPEPNDPEPADDNTDKPQDAGSMEPEPEPVSDAGMMIPPVKGLPDVKFSMEVVVPAGGEVLKCLYGRFPSNRGVVAVPSAESHYTPGSHHLLAYRSDLDEIPFGQEGVWDCSDGSWLLHARGSYYEAQQPDAHRELPAGVAHEFDPGEVIILQAHYLNSKSTALTAKVELTLHTVDPDTVEHEAGSIIFSDSNIVVGPHSRARVTMTCPITRDINPALLWSHMHSRGVHFEATTDDESAAEALGKLYVSNDWSEPEPREFPEGVLLHAGSHITFTCDYENDTNDTFIYGQSAEDNEMCILHGMYWPRMSGSAETCIGGVTSRSPL